MITLNAGRAEVVGHTAFVGQPGNVSNIVSWTDPSDYVQWSVRITKPGRFEVRINYACPAKSDGSTFTLTAGAGKLDGNVTATKGPDDYQTLSLGELELKDAGDIIIGVKPVKIAHGTLMNLASVSLIPSAQPK